MSSDKPAYGRSPYGQTSPTSTDAPKQPAANTTTRSISGQFIDSFKRHSHRTEKAAVGGKAYDSEAAHQNVAEAPLARRLKGRHLQMIAIGGSIGTGLFIASGRTLAEGGPAALILSYSITGLMLYCTVHALGELAILFPVAGAFASFSSRLIDPAWGFAMGWNYALQWLVVLPLEIVGASITIDYWGSSVPKWVWVTIFWFMILTINLFGVRGYGEAEFVFSMIKVVAVISYIMLGIVINCMGGPRGGYIGGTHWKSPGALANGFKGICAVFVNAAFAFSGTELVGLAAAETINPRKSLPTAIRQVFWRITLFYIVSLILIGLNVPFTDDRLLAGTSSTDARSSPFVASIQNAGIEILPDIMNVVIMVAVLSVGNSAVFGSSRTLAALAEQGQAPRFLAFVDRSGRPMVGILLTCAVGLLAYLVTAGGSVGGDVFTWLLSLSGLSSIFTWASICFCHIRFRHAWKIQGHSLHDLAFVSQPGIFGSYLGLFLNILVLIMQFWVALFPLNEKPSVKTFFSLYMAFPFILISFTSYKIIFKTKFVRAKDADLVSGRRELDLAGLLQLERQERALWPTWKKIYKVFC